MSTYPKAPRSPHTSPTTGAIAEELGWTPQSSPGMAHPTRSIRTPTHCFHHLTPRGSAEEKAAESQPEIFPPWEKPSPAGCRGSTAYPHKAHRGENMVSVHAVTECGQTVERVEVVTMVLRDRWWGLEYVMSGSSSHNNDSWSGRATPHSACRGEGEFMFRAFSVHASLEGGTVYKATTRNWDSEISRFQC